jgi:hypothetical protein
MPKRAERSNGSFTTKGIFMCDSYDGECLHCFKIRVCSFPARKGGHFDYCIFGISEKLAKFCLGAFGLSGKQGCSSSGDLIRVV